MSEITNNSVSILKDSSGIYISPPINIRCSVLELADTLKELGYSISDDLQHKIDSVEPYVLLWAKIENKTLIPQFVRYIYSHP